MGRVGFAGWMGLLLLVAGCAQSPDAHLQVLEEQRTAWKELTNLLAKVEDEKSLAEAKAGLDERLVHFEKIANKAKALPKPSEEVLVRLEQQRFGMQRAADNLKSEVARVRALNLKGGPEFFHHFESKNQNLFLAVQP